MIKGEGSRENEVSGPAFPDPLDSFPLQLDGGDSPLSPVSPSRYSSCNESDLERYCSANSLMGTPSMCSSVGPYNDCIESDFGSFRSFGLMDDGSLENFSLGLPLARNLGDQKPSSSAIDGVRKSDDWDIRVQNGSSGSVEATRGVSSENEMPDGDKGVSAVDCEGDFGVFKSCESKVVGRRTANLRSRKELLLGDGLVGAENDECLGGLDSKLGSQSHGEETLGEEDGISSEYLHSGDEDSMYNYGSDDDHESKLYCQGKIQCGQQAEAEKENPLLLNSSVAFGSGDWNDFELELGGKELEPLILNSFQDQDTSIVTPGIIQTEEGINVSHVPTTSNLVHGPERSTEKFVNDLASPMGIQNEGQAEQVGEMRDNSTDCREVQDINELVEETQGSTMTSMGCLGFAKQDQYQEDVPVTSNQVLGADRESKFSQNIYDGGDFEMTQDPLIDKVPLETSLNIMGYGRERVHQFANTEKIVIDEGEALEKHEFRKSKEKLDTLSNTKLSQLCFHPAESAENLGTENFEDCKPSSPSTFENMKEKLRNTPARADFSKDQPAHIEMENPEVNELYNDIVHEMEEILLDSAESTGAGFPQGDPAFQSQVTLPLRDGGSTASTSGTDDAYQLLPHLVRIDDIEVVGARQKKGDVSLSERLVGVKEYTVYRIRVWSGKDQWEVERRYRDFFTLYRRLKSLFADQGLILPSPWSSVEKESRKIFGNVSPDVISERSALIHECLHSILDSRSFSISSSTLIWFLSPQDSFPSTPTSNRFVTQFESYTPGENTKCTSTFGKTVSLIVEIRLYKSMKQTLESQHYTCAGCRKHFDDGMSLMRDFVQTLGWGKPRLCEYTGQLFCTSCHTNETAVLPARVLHFWDFTQYPVSQLAKSYLDSIHEQPMLCVSAVNPFLFSRVPALNHVMGVRKKVGGMLQYVRCPFRRSINKGLGSRRYLIESNDFFALRDLIDLSKGAFAALPVIVETASRKILEHITEQCLVCCDVGVPCSARQFCDDPSSFIFPFQEGEVQRCISCESVFHKACFRKLTSCFCGVHLGAGADKGSSEGISHENSGEAELSLLGRSSSGSSAGLLSGLFSKAKSEKVKQHRNINTVILMGSLPSTSL
ncbi:hypothetical protein HS088_TW08G00338 [Tripterygium wilfordii]|uniref:PX domain-containing protein n=1 Tax=Tripterygium wilfordii TaxID=458696 RepID=A0A7J7DBR6_TRIWF|nr:hypothetical protein HS088_TW08G00338 [Tripterygium wilfordii]